MGSQALARNPLADETRIVGAFGAIYAASVLEQQDTYVPQPASNVRASPCVSLDAKRVLIYNEHARLSGK